MNLNEQEPLVSIITITFNSEKSISRALESVSSQTYKNIEHIIKDGFSTDETSNIVRSFKSNLTKLFESRDEGIYDALNQAIAMSRGEYIMFLHSDDVFKSKTIIEEYVMAIQRSSLDGIYGNVNFVNRDGKLVRKWRAQKFAAWRLCLGWMPPHTSTMFKRAVYEEVGSFDHTFRISGDYDHLVRVFKRYGMKIGYHDKVSTVMSIGGASTAGIGSHLSKVKEDWRVIKRHNLCGIITLVSKRLSKIFQLRFL